MNDQMEIAVPGCQAVVPAEIPLAQLIVLRQIPVIEDKLLEYKATIESRVSAAVAAAMDADSIDEVKRVRAELRKEAETVDNMRKAIKQEAEKPIKALDATFKTCATNAYAQADKILKEYIDNGENALKNACENGLRDLFAELTTAHHLPWLKYEWAGIRVSLTDAKAKTQPPKKLAVQVTDFVERVAQDVAMIGGMPDAAEIMTEYRQTLNAPGAIQTVKLRHQRIAEEQAEAARRAEIRRQEEEAAARVAEIAQQMEEPVQQVMGFQPAAPVAAPVVEPVAPAAPETYTVKFAVSGTLGQLRSLKSFLESGGYEYTDIK